MKLTITTGAVTIPIERDGKVTGALHFNPKDVGFSQGFYDLLSQFEQTIAEYQEKSAKLKEDDAPGHFGLVREVTDTVRAGIDSLFGPGTAKAAFGPYTNPDVMSQFFDALTSIVTQSRKDSISKYLPEPDDKDDEPDNKDEQREDGLV